MILARFLPGPLAAVFFLALAPLPLAAPLLEQFTALPGQVSVLALADGKERLSLNPSERLAVASTSKLAVLVALTRQIEAGSRSWEDVVRLQPFWRSLPGGILQDWPDASPVTLHTLAALMMGISDNTATDGLLQTVGREAVSVLAPRNRPYLTTREAFILKDPRNADLLGRYRRGHESQRQAVLDETQTRSLPDPSVFSAGPLALDVEWFFSVEELCALIERVAELPLMRISSRHRPGMIYKSGAEPGVVNFTTLLQIQRKRACVSATWNHDRPLDMDRFTRLFTELLKIAW